MLSKRTRVSLLFIIFLFCAVFTPDFFIFSMRYLVIIICSLGIGWRWLKKQKAHFDRKYLSIFIGFVPFIIWLIISQLFHIITDRPNIAVYTYTLGHTLEIFLAGFLIGLFIIYAFDDNQYDENSLIKMIMVITVAQFICVILALVFPEVRIFFNSFIIRNSYSERLVQLAMASSSGRMDRSYGLSNNLFDSFGFITAILITLMYTVGLENNNNKIKVVSVIMIIMPLVNARTGVILVLLGIIIVSSFYMEFKTLIQSIGMLAIGVMGFMLIVSHLPKMMLDWLVNGLLDTKALLRQTESAGVYSKIFGSDLVYPSNILLGDGGMPKMLISYGVDNGYINCIWNFGLIGTILLLFGYFYMFRKAFVQTDTKMNKAMVTAIGTIFYVYLIKVYSIDNFGGIVLVYGIISVILTQNRINQKTAFD